MIARKLATAVAAAGAIAVAAPVALARPAVEPTRPSSVRAPILQIGTDCPLWSCNSNHNRRMLRQR